MTKYILATLGAVMIAGGAQARTQPVPEATPAGKPVDCISLSQIRESRVRSDSIIDFRMAGNKWYRNTLPNSCPSLGFEQRFSYHTSLNQLCAVDMIAVLETRGNGVEEGVRCGLGKFQPVTIAKPPRK